MVELDSTLGILLIATVVCAILSGTLTVQTYTYFRRFPDDKYYTKLMVLMLWSVDLLHQIIGCYSLYHYVITSVKNPALLLQPSWAVAAIHILEPIQAVTAQLFFVRRMHLLNADWWPLVVFTGGLAIISYIACTVAAIGMFTNQHGTTLFHWVWLLTVWLSTSVACDLLVAGGISLTLWRAKSGVKVTERLITKLIYWTVSTGALPAVFATLELITFWLLPNTTSSFGADIILAKLYSNSLLAFLHRRRSKTDRRQAPQDIALTTIAAGTHSPVRISISTGPTHPPFSFHYIDNLTLGDSSSDGPELTHRASSVASGNTNRHKSGTPDTNVT